MAISGTAGDDTLDGTKGDNTFHLDQGGKDTVNGKDGDDTFLFGAELTKFDTIDGGDGFDEVVVEGDYSAGVTFRDSTVVGVERLEFKRGFSYWITTKDANFAGTATIDGSLLHKGDALTFDASADTDCSFTMLGGAGDDVLLGGQAGNTFDLSNGGDDAATGGDGEDVFQMLDAFGRGDAIDGGGGLTDEVRLEGDYSAGLVINGAMLKHVETLTLGGGGGYALTLKDGVVSAGDDFEVNGEASGGALTIDASDESNAAITFYGSAFDDVVTGGNAGNIFVSLNTGGADTFVGGDSLDSFVLGPNFDAADRVDGGGGSEDFVLCFAFNGAFTATTMLNVERLLIADTSDITTVDETVAAGALLEVNAAGEQAADSFTFNGSAETDGAFLLIGGAGADDLTAGAGYDTLLGGDGDDALSGLAGDDTLTGGLGSDALTGGVGATTFVYTGVAESTGAGYDHVTTLKTQLDRFDLDVTVTGVDPTDRRGSLSTGTFDIDLAREIGAAELGAGHAVVFKPSQGDLLGHTFLIVDANASAGYQAGEDYVIEIDRAFHLPALDAGSFI